ncbi:MAG: Ig-like domain-containing protein [Bacteroidales bacterium]|jgi:hypothetical protein|nr:hypothetical protein [Bacteroidales bacterium]
MMRIVTLLLTSLICLSCTPQDAVVTDDEQDSGITLNQTVINLSSGNTLQIDARSEAPVTYQSQNPFIARVSVTGLVTAQHVGSTRVRLDNGSDTREITVNVNPVYNLYPDPILEFGITRTTLLQRLGTPDNETDEGFAYFNYSAAAPYVVYLFDENDRLEVAAVIVRTEYTTPLASHLAERYQYYASDDEYYYFINALTLDDATIGIFLTLDNADYWQVMYLPFAETKTVTEKRHNHKTMTGKINAFTTQMRAMQP